VRRATASRGNGLGVAAVVWRGGGLGLATGGIEGPWPQTGDRRHPTRSGWRWSLARRGLGWWRKSNCGGCRRSLVGGGLGWWRSPVGSVGCENDWAAACTRRIFVFGYCAAWRGETQKRNALITKLFIRLFSHVCLSIRAVSSSVIHFRRFWPLMLIVTL
jgi:hypothetical protein